ncbi:MAG: hypothetical protein WD431_10765 [Cyclobacteriaceae bacterium]
MGWQKDVAVSYMMGFPRLLPPTDDVSKIGGISDFQVSPPEFNQYLAIKKRGRFADFRK